MALMHYEYLIYGVMAMNQIPHEYAKDENDLFHDDYDEYDVSNVNISMANMVPLIMYDKCGQKYH